ncbi:succinylglutamate-semialdehyde dehydrogenase [Novosphingobium colocasiae]|uniref:N-succinylglutamate 5-semialdehyde dehydrogenase n=1 Tax=Novosphingobium colocasiae TaxID=1256513 RepID=A0A918UHD0_9SPHN|nr:succinylglutamate-semialdehyde dehydrogenase [Novosphingobium colocasiae]GGZ11981.1 N-succinylglutamate 5-semialdehyde dehydrogenase [Novosphingobium colocasiae]
MDGPATTTAIEGAAAPGQTAAGPDGHGRLGTAAERGSARSANRAEIVSFEPATGAEVWRGKASDIDDVVARARRAWPAWAAQPLSTRMELVRRFANEVRKDADKLATIIARETGKPMWEARIEVENVVNKVEVSIRAYAERTAQRKLDNALQGTMAVRHKPHGVLAVLGPYNMPAHLPNSHIVPALIAGNVVIFKPSEKAPATGELLARCFNRAGISAAVCQIAIGGPAEGQALVAHDDVDGVLFTGSANTGITINRKLSSRPDKMVVLEMGGNNAMVVWDTPKITDAAAIIVQSAFASSGQRCTAVRRLVVKSGMYDAVMAEVKSLADRLVFGAPFDEPAPFMGPVIDNIAADGLTESFLYLLSHGGRAIKHLVRPNDSLPFLSPSIIDTTAMKDRPDVELFGPILQVIRVDDFDEAIAEANNTRFGLAASLVGGSPQEYNKFWANTRAGIVNWNRPTISPSHAAPMGGIGLSGNHRPTGYYAADYCAYPVASGEIEQPRAMIGVGLR